MSDQSAPSVPQASYEQIMEMFRQFREDTERKWELDKQRYEQDRKRYEEERKQERKESEKAWNKRFAEFTDRIGEIIEAMVEGDILTKFEKFGYDFDSCCRRREFLNHKLEIHGEIDLFLEDGDTAMLVEVKTKLEVEDIRRHIVRLEKFRRYADAKNDKRHFVAAVAGAVVNTKTAEFAHENGMYVIVQSGEAVKILKPPKDFKVTVW